MLFGKIARGEDPTEQRQLNHKAMTVKELCDIYLEDLNAGLIMGKRGRPKKATTIASDVGRIHRHIIPLIGTRRVKDLIKADIYRVLKAILAGKTNCKLKTEKLRGRAIVRGGAGAATRTVGLLGGILTYAVEAGIIEANPARGIRRPKDNLRSRPSCASGTCRKVRNSITARAGLTAASKAVVPGTRNAAATASRTAVK